MIWKQHESSQATKITVDKFSIYGSRLTRIRSLGYYLNMDTSVNLEVAEIEEILRKLAYGVANARFTKREIELMAQLRESRETILWHLYEIINQHKGINPRGEKKIYNLIRAIEKICE